MAGEADQGNGNQGQEPGAGNQGQGQEPASQEGQEGQEPAGQAADISTMSEADLRTYAAKVQKQAEEARQQAASFRTRATAAEGKITETERAAMTEAQKVAADLETERSRSTELAAQVQDLTVGAAARDALGAAGAINTATALKVMGLEGITVKDGQVDATSVTKAINDLKKSDPYLFKRASADAGAGRDGAPEGGSSVNDFIRGRSGR